jgi:hypothetical protein
MIFASQLLQRYSPARTLFPQIVHVAGYSSDTAAWNNSEL